MGSQQSHDIVYSVPLQGTKVKGYSQIYRNPKHKDRLLEIPSPNIHTLKDIVTQVCTKKYPNNPFLFQIRTFTDKNATEERQLIGSRTYKEAFDEAEKIGSAIYALNLFSLAEDTTLTHGNPMKFVGIFAGNRPEWTITDMACILYGVTSIPLYDTLGTENLSYCLNQTNMTSLFCTSATAQILTKISDCGKLKNLILFDTLDHTSYSKLGSRFNVLNYEELIQIGMKQFKSSRQFLVKPSECVTFSYTSGTTGPPKGAMLSHANIVSLITALENTEEFRFEQTERHVSFLPLPHVYQRGVVYVLISNGASIASFGGDITKLKEDCQFYKPTIFPGVPRLFNRLYDAVHKAFDQATGVKKCLINQALNAKMENVKNDGSVTHTIYDKLVFSKTAGSFGGQVRKMITGSAPLKPEVQQFVKVIMCSTMIEVYGQTENTGGAFFTRLDDKQLGHVGGIASSLEFKLADLPEMNYLSTDRNQQGEPTPRGQVWLRGPSVFMGYYKSLDKTKQALTEDGWLRTGDVGMILPRSNAMRIIDRKKNIFKLAQGQYVASEKVEAVYMDSELVNEIFIHGDSIQHFVVAIISPNKDKMLALANSMGKQCSPNDPHSMQNLYNDLQVRKAVCKQLNGTGKKNGLKGFEQIKNLYLENSTFQEKGILTNTMKLQRFNARQQYKSQIAHMYEEKEII